MTTTAVILVCVGSIAACAALVFAVETLVAFGLHWDAPASKTLHLPIPFDGTAKRRQPAPVSDQKAA